MGRRGVKKFLGSFELRGVERQVVIQARTMQPELSAVERSESVALLAGAGVSYLDGLLLETLVFFSESGEEEGVGDGGFAPFDGGDDVAAAQPVGFGLVVRGPVGRVIGVRVVKAGDLQAQAARLALDLHQFGGGDLKAVVGGISAGVAGRNGHGHAPAILGGIPQQSPAALLGVIVFAMGADGRVDRRGQPQRRRRANGREERGAGFHG